MTNVLCADLLKREYEKVRRPVAAVRLPKCIQAAGVLLCFAQMHGIDLCRDKTVQCTGSRYVKSNMHLELDYGFT